MSNKKSLILLVVFFIIGTGEILYGLLFPQFNTKIAGKVISCSESVDRTDSTLFTGDYYVTVNYSVNGVEYEDCTNTFSQYNEDESIIIYPKKDNYNEIHHNESDLFRFLIIGILNIIPSIMGIFYKVFLKKEYRI